MFLVGARAYKMKRAVRYPYMDFSTLALHQANCEREVALSATTAAAEKFLPAPQATSA